jgi:hypothetical protein
MGTSNGFWSAQRLPIILSRAVTKVFCTWGKLLKCAPPPIKMITFLNFCINFINFAPLHVLCLGWVPHLPHPCYGSDPKYIFQTWYLNYAHPGIIIPALFSDAIIGQKSSDISAIKFNIRLIPLFRSSWFSL